MGGAVRSVGLQPRLDIDKLHQRVTATRQRPVPEMPRQMHRSVIPRHPDPRRADEKRRAAQASENRKNILHR
jgi:hypothetical protein